MMLRVTSVIAFLICWLPAAAFAQTGTIAGTVTDAASGEGLPGANVIVEGTDFGASTNAEGAFEISNVPAGSHVVRIRFVGYQEESREVDLEAGERVELAVALEQAEVGLDELIVTGTAGDSRRRSIGNAVSQLDVAATEELVTNNTVSDVLQSSVPGLTLIPGSGTAGTSANIRLRGANSINAGSNPTIYVDGVRLNDDGMGNFGVFGQNTTALDALNPQDIESVEVIKGPAASTLYGADAAAGVIQIITKSGSMGERNLQWNARIERGQQYWPESLRPTNYAVATEERINDPETWPGFEGAQVGDIISHVPLSDHPEALRNGVTENYLLSVQGGGENYAFFLSGSRSTEGGVFYNNFSNRNSLRGNFQVLITDELDARFNISYANNHIRLPLNDNTADGPIISSWLATPGRDYAPPGSPPETTGYLILGPEAFNTYDNQTRADRAVFGGTINYEPFDWLENRLRVGFDLNSSRAEVYFPPGNPFADRTSFGLPNSDGLIAKGRPQTRELTLDYSGTIEHEISEDLVSNTSVGMQYLATRFTRTDAFGQDLGSEGIRSVGAAAVTTGGESFSEESMLGFFVQEQLGYRDRLFLTGALRVDNHSAFGAEINRVFYPKASLSYVISEEPFFNVGALDNLRLRAAWGQAGNAPGPFDATRTYGVAATTLADGSSVSALQYGSFGNPDLEAERGTEIEVGFDATLFGNLLDAEATYYYNYTRDALISVPVPQSTGFSGSQLRNLGEVRNQGVELTLNARPVQLNNFALEHTLNFSYNDNELVSFGEDRGSVIFGVYAPVHRFEEGKPLGAFWADAVQYDDSGNLVTDENGQPVLQEQQVYKGPSVPPFETMFSTRMTLFESLELYALLDYRAGHYQFNVKDWRRDRAGVSWETVNPDADPDEVQARMYPAQTDIHVQPADYVRLRQVAVRYLLPAEWTGPLGVERASIALSGNNMALWTRYGGADPEVNFHGDSTFDRNDSWTLPQTRQISAILNFSF